MSSYKKRGGGDIIQDGCDVPSDKRRGVISFKMDVMCHHIRDAE